MEKSLAEKVRDIIMTYYTLDEKGNPTIPTEDDVGQIDEGEFAVTALDEIWKLVK